MEEMLPKGMNLSFSILLVVVGLFVGALIVIVINKIKVSAAQKEADKLIRDAQKEAEKAKRDGILELKEESFKLKKQTDEEIREKKKELNDLNQRIDNREKSLDKRDELLTEREKEICKKSCLNFSFFMEKCIKFVHKFELTILG